MKSNEPGGEESNSVESSFALLKGEHIVHFEFFPETVITVINRGSHSFHCRAYPVLNIKIMAFIDDH